MTHLRRITIFAQLCFLLAICANSASAQCQQCKPSTLWPGHLVCSNSTSGGKECNSNGDTCCIMGVCGRGRPGEDDGIIIEESLRAPVHLGEDTIKDIAGLHPRFALALAFLSKHGLLGGNSRISMVPVEVSRESVESYLSSGRSPGDLLNKLKERKEQRQRQWPVIVVYDYTVERSADNSAAALLLKVVKGHKEDPNYSSLRIDLIGTPTSNSGKQGYTVANWRID